MKTHAHSILPARFALASCLALGLCTAALAQTGTPAAAGSTKPDHGLHHGPKGDHGGMQRMDKDGNKLISREEAKGHPHLEKDFDTIDANKDGQLSQDELRTHMQKVRGEHKGEGHSGHRGGPGPVKRLDTNKDGKLSRDEVKGHPMLEKNFERIDANKDGSLSEEELKAARKTEMDARMKHKADANK